MRVRRRRRAGPLAVPTSRLAFGIRSTASSPASSPAPGVPGRGARSARSRRRPGPRRVAGAGDLRHRAEPHGGRRCCSGRDDAPGARAGSGGVEGSARRADVRPRQGRGRGGVDQGQRGRDRPAALGVDRRQRRRRGPPGDGLTVVRRHRDAAVTGVAPGGGPPRRARRRRCRSPAARGAPPCPGTIVMAAASSPSPRRPRPGGACRSPRSASSEVGESTVARSLRASTKASSVSVGCCTSPARVRASSRSRATCAPALEGQRDPPADLDLVVRDLGSGRRLGGVRVERRLVERLDHLAVGDLAVVVVLRRAPDADGERAVRPRPSP